MGVVVPAYCESDLIRATIGSIPAFIDVIYVVDDASRDDTSAQVEHAQRSGESRVVLLQHSQNLGVGAAIATGYEHAINDGCDLMVVMAGDHQMNPADLPALLGAAVDGSADYVKGNRFLHPRAAHMPRLRRWGSRVLAMVTRATTGLSVDDTQCGYTVLSAVAARRIPLDLLWPRYGYPNHLLALLAAAGVRVEEVPVEPVYAGERSGLRPWHFFQILLLILGFALGWRSRRSAGGHHGPGQSEDFLRNTRLGVQLAAHSPVLNDDPVLPSDTKQP